MRSRDLSHWIRAEIPCRFPGSMRKPWNMCREIRFSVFDTETLNLNLFFEIVLLSPRPGNHLNTFLASFTSSGVESQPEWTNIHSIHASGGQSRVSSRRNPTLEHASGSSRSSEVVSGSAAQTPSPHAPGVRMTVVNKLPQINNTSMLYMLSLYGRLGGGA